MYVKHFIKCFIHTHCRRLCKTTEIFLTIENVFFYLIFTLAHLVFGFLIFVYYIYIYSVYIYIYIYIYIVYIYIYSVYIYIYIYICTQKYMVPKPFKEFILRWKVQSQHFFYARGKDCNSN